MQAFPPLHCPSLVQATEVSHDEAPLLKHASPVPPQWTPQTPVPHVPHAWPSTPGVHGGGTNVVVVPDPDVVVLVVVDVVLARRGAHTSFETSGLTGRAPN